MSIILPNPPPEYDASAESQRNQIIEQADASNHKRGSDVELGLNERIIMRSPDGTRYALTVSNAGALEINAI
jgi:hypothetical protein